MAAGAGSRPEPSGEPKSKTPATTSWSASAATIRASQSGRTTSSASQNTNSEPWDDLTPAFRAAPGPSGCAASISRIRGIRCGPSLDAGACTVLRPVVGDHDFPLGGEHLAGDSAQLLVQPRHAVADCNDHTDQWAQGRALRVDVVQSPPRSLLAYRSGGAE